MRVSIKNLGVLKQAELDLGDLTLICGANNTGKTYATYALYGFLSNWRRFLSADIPDSTIDALLNDGIARLDITPHVMQSAQIVRAGCDEYAKEISDIFASNPDLLDSAEFCITPSEREHSPAHQRPFTHQIGSGNDPLLSFSKPNDDSYLTITLRAMEAGDWPRDVLQFLISAAVIELLFDSIFPRPFIASAERTGATMFRAELLTRSQKIVARSQKTARSQKAQKALFDTPEPDYPLPVEENIDFIRGVERITKRTSFIAKSHQHILKEFSDVIGGDYFVDENDAIYFQPTHGQLSLTMDESSSAIRALLVIGLYLRHVARPGDLLMVDEPELNLHPTNQRRIGRLFARLVNLGIRVFATTHSDYIVKELNTLIMLNQDKPHLNRIAENRGYQREELLDSDRVRVYIAERSQIAKDQRESRDHTLVRASIDSELGIEARSFDETIDEMNEIQEEIVWGSDG